jgi:YD repeat-containing protein
MAESSGFRAPFAAKSCQRYVGAAAAPPVAGAAVSRYEYDGDGNLTKQTLAPQGLNLQTRLGYDALQRVRDSTDAKGGTTSVQYDGGDQVTQVTDPRNLSTQYLRNGLGETTQLVSPDTGAASHTHDDAGNLTGRIDSRGVQERYGYDALNRLITASYSLGGQASQALSWGWDLTGSGYANGIGRLGRSDHPDGSARWQYGAQGRVTQALQTVSVHRRATRALRGRADLQGVASCPSCHGENDRITSHHGECRTLVDHARLRGGIPSKSIDAAADGFQSREAERLFIERTPSGFARASRLHTFCTIDSDSRSLYNHQGADRCHRMNPPRRNAAAPPD